MAEIVRRGSGGIIPRLSEPFGRWEPWRMMRDLLRWDPFVEMAPLAGEEGVTFTPRFDVKETKESYIFKADLPGVKEDDLDISLSGDRLTVSGKRETEKEEKGETYYTCERAYGTFTRSFSLPAGVDAEHVNADFHDGVLTLIVPKKAEVQPKKISLKAEKTKAKA